MRRKNWLSMSDKTTSCLTELDVKKRHTVTRHGCTRGHEVELKTRRHRAVRGGVEGFAVADDWLG